MVDVVSFSIGQDDAVHYATMGYATIGRILRQLQRVDTASRANVGARGIRIAYANPTHEAVFREASWLESIGHWSKHDHRLEHGVAFYRTKP